MATAHIAVMANGDIGLERVHPDVDRALSLKREQLDREIEQFRSQKDQEYRDYETQLRSLHAGEIQHPRSPEVRVEDYKEKIKRPTYHRRDTTERRQARRKLNARQTLDQAFEAGHDSDSKEDEQDSRAEHVIASSDLLDLIDSKTPRANGNLHAGPAGSEQKQGLSSSASLHPPLLLPFGSSPVQPPAVSWSAPEHSPSKTHHRSDSANSILSISSLRSSMKDPKAPKSPKRVLFSIEDGVVSPSTSPTLSRRPNSAEANEPDVMQSMFTFARRGKEKKKKKNRRKERGDGDRGRRGRDGQETTQNNEAIGSSAIDDSWTKPVPFRTPVAQVNGDSQAMLPPPAEDYERIEKEEDDLFAFDEDLDAVFKSEPEADTPTVIEDNDELESHTKPLTETGTSPHAGSLPIEIKWPGRRNSGGIG